MKARKRAPTRAENGKICLIDKLKIHNMDRNQPPNSMTACCLLCSYKSTQIVLKCSHKIGTPPSHFEIDLKITGARHGGIALIITAFRNLHAPFFIAIPLNYG